MPSGRRVLLIEENPVYFGLAAKRVKSLAPIIHKPAELQHRWTMFSTVRGKGAHISVTENIDEPVEDLFVKDCTDGNNLNRTSKVSPRSY